MTVDFQNKATKILSIAEERGIELRLLGALSIKLHCAPNRKELERPISDIDFVAHGKDRSKIENLLKDFGCKPAQMFNSVNPDRLLFFEEGGTRVDVFLDVFQMCHKLDFRDRIALDKPTLPPADLLATKLQIVELNEKDLKDMVSLLRDHQLSQSDSAKDTINISYIADLCAKDWGIYRTFTGSIKSVSQFLSNLPLPESDKGLIQMKLDELLKSIETAPKSMKWKMRARIGEKRPWYDLPETRILGEAS